MNLKEIKSKLAAKRGTVATLAVEVLSTRRPVRTGHYTGSGRRTKAVDHTGEVCDLLRSHGIECVTGNDAPRGGVTGQWVRRMMPKEQAAYRAAQAARAAVQAAHDAATLRGRAEQVARHLALPAIAIKMDPGARCHTADLGGTAMIEDYHGCGRGTAYVSGSALVAYHYGYRMPKGWTAPEGTEVRRVALSCTQVCFF